MPTYEYVCEKCDHHFEVVQSITREALKVCPREHCRKKPWGKGRVRRAITGGAGLLFKGSGFYITDYRSEGYKKAAKQDAPAAAPAKTEAKAEAKAETKKSPGAGAAPAKGAAASGS